MNKERVNGNWINGLWKSDILQWLYAGYIGQNGLDFLDFENLFFGNFST